MKPAMRVSGVERRPDGASPVHTPRGPIDRLIPRPNSAPFVWYPLFPRFTIDTASFAAVLFLFAFALRTRGERDALTIRTRLGDDEHDRDRDR